MANTHERQRPRDIRGMKSIQCASPVNAALPPGVGNQAGARLIELDQRLDHSMAEKAVPVERDERTHTAKYLLVVTSKIAAAVGITR